MPKALSIALVAAFLLAAEARSEVQNDTIQLASGQSIKVTEIADGLERPWGLAFLPDGRMLVTERPGRLRLIEADGTLREAELEGVPDVAASGQGGLLDIELDPDFAQNHLVWLSFAEAGDGGVAGTAVGRGRFVNDAIEGFETVWRQQDKVPGDKHFGSRIVFAGDGTLYVTTGERFRFDPAQDKGQTLGKVVRITPDGEPAPDNPFIGEAGTLPEIFSLGHRNIQAAAIDPATGDLFVAEMGPRGGDELNRVRKGLNYGWPLVSWGTHYDGQDIPDPPSRPEFDDALAVWTPVIAPSGMIFYDGEAFPDYVGHAFIGGLVARGVTRVELKDGEVVDQELIPLGARIRDVVQGPDGAIYVVTDDPSDGSVWKLAPLGN